MSITERAALVLQEIEADLALAERATPGPWSQARYDFQANRIYDVDSKCVADVPAVITAEFTDDGRFIARSRTGWPTALRMLKSAMEYIVCDLTCFGEDCDCSMHTSAASALAALCDQWEASRRENFRA